MSSPLLIQNCKAYSREYFFGPSIDCAAKNWLQLLDAELMLLGLEAGTSRKLAEVCTERGSAAVWLRQGVHPVSKCFLGEPVRLVRLSN